jgi:hypothetical protein
MNARTLVGGGVLLAVASSLSLLQGCGLVPPRVKYSAFPAADSATTGDSLAFRHRRSVIVVAKNDKAELTATAAPYEFDASGKLYAPLYSIAGVYDWRSSTQLQITYVDNTRFVDQMDVTTKDNVGDTIDKFGKAAVALLPLIGGIVSGSTAARQEAGKLDFKDFKRTFVDPALLSEGQTESSWAEDDLNPGWCVRLRNVVAEPGIRMTDYMAARLNTSSRDFPVPACASAQVDVSLCTNTPAFVSLPVTYASPDRVIPTALPSSGSLKMYSVCGAKVTPAQSEDRTDILTYLDKATKAVKDIKAARKQN